MTTEDHIPSSEPLGAFETLRRQVERFKTMIDMLPTVVFETDVHGRITFANKYGIQFFGVSQEQYRDGVSIEDLVDPDDLYRLRKNCAAVLDGASPCAHEYTVRTMRGAAYSVIVFSDAIRDAHNTAVGMRGILVDISLRKQIETALRESDSRYKNLFMTIDDAAFIYDAATGRILDANPAAERIYGYMHREYVLMNIADLSAQTSGSAAIDTGGYQSPLRYHKKSNGAVFPVEVTTGTFDWQNRRCRFDIYRDLAFRRKAELELRESEARLMLYLNAMHDGLCDWNLTTNEMFYSPGWIAMLGYEPASVPPFAHFWRAHVHRDDDPGLQSALDDHLCGATGQLKVEFRMRAGDQSWKWVSCRGSVVEWTDDGAPSRLIATFADITEGKANEMRLHHIAHENRLLMEHASDAIIIIGNEGRLLDANTKATELFGYSREELLAFDINMMVPAENLAVHPFPYQALRAGASLQEERVYRNRDGRLMTVEASLKSLPDGRIHAILRNITERKRTESELKSIIMSEVYEKLFIKLRVFQHGESMAMNLNRLLLFAQNITDLYTVLRRQYDSDTMASGIPAAQRVHVAVNEYNLLVYPELRSIGLLLQAIEDESQPIDRVSMHRASGRELMKLNENVKHLIGRMSELLSEPGTAEAHGDFVKNLRRDMLRDVEALKHHVRDLMKLTESELACDVGKTVSTVVGKFTPNAGGVPVRLVPTALKRCAIGKPGEIGEIVSILIQNALQAIDSDPSFFPDEQVVEVECRDSAEKIVIMVRDTGPGVAEEIRERIFEDGFTTKADGHGFGLSYARSALKKYGGRILCEPNAPRGARFRIELVVLN